MNFLHDDIYLHNYSASVVVRLSVLKDAEHLILWQNGII